MLTYDDLRQRVDTVIVKGTDDDEAAHSMEDQLHLDIIGFFCPDWVRAEIERLSHADFARWCS